jgi:hypothetical protein
MKNLGKILIVLAAVFSSFMLGFLLSNLANRSEYVESSLYIQIPKNVSEVFLHHPEAWNKVFMNVSSIPEFWNATIPDDLRGRSIPEIVSFFKGRVFFNSSEFAYCYVYVPQRFHQALNQTLTQIGFLVYNIAYGHPN